MPRILKAWLPALLWMGLIFAMSTDLGAGEQTSRILGPLLRRLFPGSSPEFIAAAHLAVRKSAHFTEYAVLALLLRRALRQTKGRTWSEAKVLAAALALAACYAGTDEFHQRFVPDRTPALGDVAIDTAGAATALTIVLLRERQWDRRRPAS